MNEFTEITVHTTHAGSELVASVMLDYTDGGVAISDIEDVKELFRTGKTWDYADESVLIESGEVLVKAYVPADKQNVVSQIERALIELKKRAETDVGTLETVKRTVDGDAWRDVWKKHFKPIRIGNITIVPEWIEYSPAVEEKTVIIGSNMAFGTGEHETTAMCVEFLQKYVKESDVVADVGTGSGILGIAVEKLGAKRVIMTDIDECAIDAAKYNVKLNGVKNAEIILKNLLDEDLIKADVIVANIMAEVLILFAADIGKNLKEHGKIILSGILADRLNKVKDAYVLAGFRYIESKTQGEWSALVMGK